jgi:hypothetical protein
MAGGAYLRERRTTMPMPAAIATMIAMNATTVPMTGLLHRARPGGAPLGVSPGGLCGGIGDRPD